jgi:hypothetical protein
MINELVISCPTTVILISTVYITSNRLEINKIQSDIIISDDTLVNV